MSPKTRGMIVEEFRSQRNKLLCADCGHVGLEERLNRSNNGVQVICPLGGSRHPLGHTLFLKQRGPGTRRSLSRSGESLDELWTEWGNRCAGCGLATGELEILGLSRERHHAPPLEEVKVEEETTLVPLCTRCHRDLTENHALHTRQLRMLLLKRTRELVASLAERKSLPASVKKDSEVREAIQQSMDEHNLQNREPPPGAQEE